MREGKRNYFGFSGAEGDFEISGIDASGDEGIDEGRCVAKGFGPATLKSFSPKDLVRFILEPAGRLRIEVALAERALTPSFAWTVQVARVDDRGQAKERRTEFAQGSGVDLDHLNPGVYRLTVSAPGRRAVEFADVRVTPGQERKLQAVLERAQAGDEALPAMLFPDDTDLFREQVNAVYSKLSTPDERREFKGHFRKLIDDPDRKLDPARRRAVEYVLGLPED